MLVALSHTNKYADQLLAGGAVGGVVGRVDVVVAALLAVGAWNCQNSTPGVHNDGLGLRDGAANVEVDVEVAQTGVAIDRQDVIREELGG